jgi:hypothetical protein
MINTGQYLTDKLPMTTTDLVSFGNYLLSDARRDSIMSNPETSPEAKEELLKQVTDADIANWENLKL